jgi:hypothetical protein
MEAYWGSGGIAPCSLDLCTRWRWVFSFTPRPLYTQRKCSWYPLDRRLGGPQSRSERSGEEKNSQPMSGLRSPIIQPIAQRYTTELYCTKRFWMLRTKTQLHWDNLWLYMTNFNLMWIFTGGNYAHKWTVNCTFINLYRVMGSSYIYGLMCIKNTFGNGREVGWGGASSVRLIMQFGTLEEK